MHVHKYSDVGYGKQGADFSADRSTEAKGGKFSDVCPFGVKWRSKNTTIINYSASYIDFLLKYSKIIVVDQLNTERSWEETSYHLSDCTNVISSVFEVVKLQVMQRGV